MSIVLTLIAFAACIILMVIMIAKAKMHAVSALLLSVILLGLLMAVFTGAGIVNLVDKDGKSINNLFTLDRIEGVINTGFANTIRSIAVIIVLGSVLGKVLEETGAAKAITLFVIKVVGEKRVMWAIGFSAFILGIPIFSDTVTIMLIPIVSAVAIGTGASMMSLGTALAVGAQITHAIVPPTPGPLAAATMLGVPLAQSILWGLIVSIPAYFAAMLWAKFACKEMVKPEQKHIHAYEQAKAESLPSTIMSFMPILLPLILIFLNSIVGIVAKGTSVAKFFAFIGSPIVALLSGCIFAMILTGERWKTKLVQNDWIEESLHAAAMPIVVTGLGGALALFIQNAQIATLMADGIVKSGIPPIILPIILSAVIHIVTGSTTLGVLTSAALMQPMIAAVGLSPLATFLACASASMFLKHGNSSAFWVATSLSNMSFPQGLKGVGGGCTAASAAACIFTVILNVAGVI